MNTFYNALRWCALVVAPLIPDRLWLSLQFKFHLGYAVDFKNPKTFNEKLQWLKLHDRNPEYTKMVDKIDVKPYVASIIGEEHIIPTLGVYDSVDEIDFDALPDQFVLKCSHDSGGIVICSDKSKLNIEEAKKKLRKSLRGNFYYRGREWFYKNVQPRLIAEEYLVDESGWELKDYKVFVMNGEAKFIEVDYNRFVSHKLNVYSRDWQFIDFYMTSPNDRSVQIPKPQKLDLMLEYAEKIATHARATFLRVDFYSVKDRLYVGELTFTPGSGMIDFHPKEYDKILGDMLKLNM